MFNVQTVLRYSISACLISGFVLTGVLHGARQALAQACHGPDPELRLDHDRPFRAAIAALAATYDVNGYAGNYEGLYASFAYRQPWYGVEVLLPSYRLDRKQGIDYGLGDMLVTLRGTVLRAYDGDLSFGVELPLMVPTGDPERELGMGRAMPMPDVYLALRVHSWLLRAQLGYGRMVGGMYVPESSPGSAPHHGGGSAQTKMTSPLVNPMNMSEFEHSLLVGYAVRPQLSAHARWWGAVPIADEMGVLRQAVAVGLTARSSRFDLTFELQRTVSGAAFEWKPLLQLGASF